MSKYIDIVILYQSLFTKDPKSILCNYIPYGHIQLVGYGCPYITVIYIIQILSSTNTMTMFVSRKVTGDVYGCKTLFYMLYFI